MVTSLREAHPEELKLAEAAVEARLVSPRTWLLEARKAYIDTTVDDAEKSGTLLTQITALLMALGLSVGSLTIVIGMMIQHVPLLPFLGVNLALWLVLMPRPARSSRPGTGCRVSWRVGWMLRTFCGVLHVIGTASLTFMCAAFRTTLHRAQNSPPC